MIKTIDRRTMLKSTGVALTLPMLESMNRNGSVLPPPQRLVFLCTTLGLHPPNLWPKNPGKDYEATAYLKILQDHRNDFTLFSGLQHEDQTGRQPHDSEMTFLTSARKPGMGGFRNSVSIDQIAATQLKNKTRFSSITLGSAKSQSQSYTAGGVMIPAQTNPAKLFEYQKRAVHTYSDLPNNRAANLIIFWEKTHLHNLIRTYTFINFEVIFYLHVYSDLHDY